MLSAKLFTALTPLGSYMPPSHNVTEPMPRMGRDCPSIPSASAGLGRNGTRFPQHVLVGKGGGRKKNQIELNLIEELSWKGSTTMIESNCLTTSGLTKS